MCVPVLTRNRISNVMCRVLFFVFNQLWLEMIVCVVDIGGIVDHHCSLHNCTVNKIHMFTVLPETRFT
jgi:hypothetical protein